MDSGGWGSFSGEERQEEVVVAEEGLRYIYIYVWKQTWFYIKQTNLFNISGQQFEASSCNCHLVAICFHVYFVFACWHAGGNLGLNLFVYTCSW